MDSIDGVPPPDPTRVPDPVCICWPTFAACQARNAGRGVTDRMVPAALRHHYADFEWCVAATKPRNVLDTTSMTVQETVSVLTEIVGASPLV